MTTKKPREKKPAAPTEAAPGETFEALLRTTIKERAEQKERTEQTHLVLRAWQLYGNLIFHGVLTPPDQAVMNAPFEQEESSKRDMAERILDDIGSIVLSFDAMGLGPDGDAEF